MCILQLQSCISLTFFLFFSYKLYKCYMSEWCCVKWIKEDKVYSDTVSLS